MWWGKQYSATFTVLCQMSPKKQWCFSFSETTPILAGIEVLLNSWLWAGIHPNYLLFPYGARPGHAPTFPFHVRFYTEKKCGFCSQRETKQVIVCWIRLPDYLRKDAGKMSVVTTFPSLQKSECLNPHVPCELNTKWQFFHIEG